MMKKILVVDDEKQMVDLMIKSLSDEGTKVIGLQDPQAALDYLGRHDVDLVITDISMPRIQGTDLFFRMRRLNPFLQVIIITAYPSLNNITLMLESGAGDFVIKPFEMDYLVSVVQENFSRINRWKSLRKEWLKHKKSQLQL